MSTTSIIDCINLALVLALDLISKKKLLAEVSASDLTIRYGNVFLSETSTMEVMEIIRHEDYDPVTNKNDIALLRAKNPFFFGVSAQPIPLLFNSGEFPETTEFIVTGYGVTQEGGTSLSDRMQEVKLSYVSRQKCRAAYSTNGIFGIFCNLFNQNSIDESMICAAAPGKDSKFKLCLNYFDHSFLTTSIVLMFFAYFNSMPRR